MNEILTKIPKLVDDMSLHNLAASMQIEKKLAARLEADLKGRTIAVASRSERLKILVLLQLGWRRSSVGRKMRSGSRTCWKWTRDAPAKQTHKLAIQEFSRPLSAAAR